MQGLRIGSRHAQLDDVVLCAGHTQSRMPRFQGRISHRLTKLGPCISCISSLCALGSQDPAQLSQRLHSPCGDLQPSDTPLTAGTTGRYLLHVSGWSSCVEATCRMRPPPGTGWGPLNWPSWASELALARATRISWAACLFSALPPHFCRAAEGTSGVAPRQEW